MVMAHSEVKHPFRNFAFFHISPKLSVGHNHRTKTLEESCLFAARVFFLIQKPAHSPRSHNLAMPVREFCHFLFDQEHNAVCRR